MSSLEKVHACISDGRNFLLKGGAGSGKTYSLVDVIESIYLNNQHARIACITYTNAAVDVINGRYSNSRLQTSTIHTFLWREVRKYQRELKLAILHLTDSDKIPSRLDRTALNKVLQETEVTYGEYLSLANGQISHDELIVIAEYLYEQYPLLRRVTKSKFDFIFIDEYQDTHKEVMSMILDQVQRSESTNQLVVGLFGDDMQKIYDRGIETLKDEWLIEEVTKEDNFRSSSAIVDKVNNHLRYDGLKQKAVGEQKDFSSSINFYYSSNSGYEIEALAERLDWDNYRALYLTHRVLARNAGYPTLYALYDTPSWALTILNRLVRESKLNIEDESSLGSVIEALTESGVDVAEAGVDGGKLQVILNDKYRQVGHLSKRLVTDTENLCPLLEYAIRIFELKNLYDSGNIYELLKKLKTGKNALRVDSHKSRKRLKSIFDGLSSMNEENTIGDIFAYASLHQDVFVPGDRFLERSIDAPSLLSELSSVSFSEVIKLAECLREDAKHGTQHSAKGRAFDNVIVVLDNGNWFQGSNYASIFNATGFDNETRRLIYTSCSRAVKNLAVFYFASSKDWRASSIVTDATGFFGAGSVINLDD